MDIQMQEQLSIALLVNECNKHAPNVSLFTKLIEQGL